MNPIAKRLLDNKSSFASTLYSDDLERAAAEIGRLETLRDEMLDLLREAHTDAVNDFDRHVECSTDSSGEFTCDEDREIAAEMQGFIERLVAVIEKAERVQ